MSRLRNYGAVGMLFALLVAFEFAPAARAEEFSNLHALLDKGGTPVSAEALRNLLTGAIFGGQSLTNQSEFESHYTADGRSTGTWATGGGSGRIWGTWTIRDDGALCTASENDWNSGVTHLCTFWYQLGDNCYAAASRDRSANVRLRKVKR